MVVTMLGYLNIFYLVLKTDLYNVLIVYVGKPRLREARILYSVI